MTEAKPPIDFADYDDLHKACAAYMMLTQVESTFPTSLITNLENHIQRIIGHLEGDDIEATP